MKSCFVLLINIEQKVRNRYYGNKQKLYEYYYT